MRKPIDKMTQCNACGIKLGPGYCSTPVVFREKLLCHSCDYYWRFSEDRLGRPVSFNDFLTARGTLTIIEKGDTRKGFFEDLMEMINRK